MSDRCQYDVFRVLISRFLRVTEVAIGNQHTPEGSQVFFSLSCQSYFYRYHTITINVPETVFQMASMQNMVSVCERRLWTIGLSRKINTGISHRRRSCIDFETYKSNNNKRQKQTKKTRLCTCAYSRCVCVSKSALRAGARVHVYNRWVIRGHRSRTQVANVDVVWQHVKTCTSYNWKHNWKGVKSITNQTNKAN